jgi:hypothetical protein
MRVNLTKQLWFCDPCGFGGSVIELHARLNNIDTKEAMKQLLPEDREKSKGEQVKLRYIESYEYQNIHGDTVFWVDRMESPLGDDKQFYQWHEVNGKRVNNMDGVTRCLYRMPIVSREQELMLVEGEKCVQAAAKIGFPATTNPGGSGAWLPAYAEYLKDKDITVCPDEDATGVKWLKAVMGSLEGLVKTVRVCRVPKPYNDISDLVEGQGREEAFKQISEIMEKTPRIPRGIVIPVYNSEELEAMYSTSVRTTKYNSVDLGNWLPSFKRYSRPLSPGDMFVILAATGGGKTAIAQNIAISQSHLTVLIFELELAGEQMAERFTAMTHRINAHEIEKKIKKGARFDTKGWNHIWTCPQAKISVDEMEKYINRAELKIGQRPSFVIVDYIGLVKGERGKRYERMSSIAESLKLLARSTNTVVGVCSQVHRQADDDPSAEIRLSSGKDSGSIENSAQLVMGAWRLDATTMNIRILKRTNGSAGHVITCNFNGPQLRISERTRGIDGEETEEAEAPQADLF